MNRLVTFLVSIIGGLVAARMPLNHWLPIYIWGGIIGILIVALSKYEK